MAAPSKQTDSGLTLEEHNRDNHVDLLLRVASGRKFYPPAWPKGEAPALQAEFEPLLQLAIDAPEQLYRQQFLARLQELDQGGLVIKLGSTVRGGKIRLAHNWEYRDRHAVLSHALLLVIEDELPYGQALRRCIRCGRFYRARRNPKGGPANRKFCGSTCRVEYHDSAERKAAEKAARKHK